MQSKNKCGGEELRPQNSRFEKHIRGGGRFGHKNVQFMESTCKSTLVHEDILFLSLFELVSKGIVKGIVGPNGKTSSFSIFSAG